MPSIERFSHGRAIRRVTAVLAASAMLGAEAGPLGPTGSEGPAPTLAAPVDEPRDVSPPDLSELLSRQDLAPRLGAWGVGIDEIEHLVSVLSEDERRRLALHWLDFADDHAPDGAAGPAAVDRMAMYLSLVSHMRYSVLFVQVVSNRL